MMDAELIMEVRAQRRDIRELVKAVDLLQQAIAELIELADRSLQDEQKRQVVPVTMPTEDGQIVRYAIAEETWLIVHLDANNVVRKREVQYPSGQRREVDIDDDGLIHAHFNPIDAAR